jgi:tetratricopeptide (TPR) repeat protein
MTEQDLIHIDNYFQQKLSENDKISIEKRISEESDFAETVAFYANTKALAREKALAERHNEWQNRPKPTMKISRIATGMAAMLVLVLGFWFFTKDTDTLSEKANKYIETNLTQLPQTMGTTQDSLQMGIGLYNNKKYTEATAIFEKLIEKTPKAIEYLGLSAMQSKQYDVAELYFEKLANNTDLLDNKGKFYLGLNYLKQGDESRGKQALQEVIDENLGGKTEVEKILE